MIMRKILYILVLAAAAMSCVREKLPSGDGWTSDQTTDVFLRFGENGFDEIEINTKATLGVVPESRVLNIFMYIFNSEGDRVFSHYFDNRYLVESEAEMEAPDGNCWWVDNRVLPGESEDEDTKKLSADAWKSAIAAQQLYPYSRAEKTLPATYAEKVKAIDPNYELPKKSGLHFL